jgi:hypothetical protein
MKFFSIGFLSLFFIWNTKAIAAKSGTSIGGANQNFSFEATWCKSSLSRLNEYLKRAKTIVEKNSNYDVANKILVKGLVDTLGNEAKASRTFLREALLLGLHTDEVLNLSNTTSEDIYSYLAPYYQFLLDKLSLSLDINPYVIPEVHQLNTKVTSYESKKINYAQMQTEWILENLVTSSTTNGQLVIRPKNRPLFIQVVSTTLESNLKLANESLLKEAFACPIEKMNILEDKIEAYMQGNQEIFIDPALGFLEIYSDLKTISEEFKSTGCILSK